jgi:large subunit ribosomal protein L19e
MNLQKKLAAKILKCGVNKVWIDPKNDKVKQAITRRDIRRFIKEGVIKKLPAKKRAKHEEKGQRKIGSRKGKKGARMGRKTEWFKIVRPQRKLLRELKSKNQLQDKVYRKIYKMIKGNVFRSKAHLMLYLKDKGYLKGESK